MKLICVTGMHRSGTSVLSRAVNLLGADLGPADSLMPATEDNPRGYWEHREVMEINNEIFRALGGWWNRPPALADGWERDRKLDPLRARAGRVLQDAFPSEGTSAIKDPRMAILLPFWRTVAPIAATIVSLRDPRAVATSILRRDGMEAEVVAELWLRHTVDALANAPGALLVPFEEWFSAPEALLTKIASYLGMDEPDPSTLKAVLSFVEPGLRRSDGDQVPLGPKMQRALLVHRLLTTDPTADALGLIVEQMRELTQLEAELRQTKPRQKALTEEQDRLQSALRLKEQELAALQQQGGRRQEQVLRDLKARDQQIAAKDQQITTLEQRVSGEKERHAGLSRELEGLRTQMHQLQTDRAALKADLERHAEVLAAVRAEAAKRAAQAIEQRESRIEVQRELRLLRASTTREIDLLSGWLVQLRTDYRRLLASRRWRIGSAIGRVVEAMTPGRAPQKATARMDKTFAQFGTWSKRRAKRTKTKPTARRKRGSKSVARVRRRAQRKKVTAARAAKAKDTSAAVEDHTASTGVSREWDEHRRDATYAEFVAGTEQQPAAVKEPADVRVVAVMAWTPTSSELVTLDLSRTAASCAAAGAALTIIADAAHPAPVNLGDITAGPDTVRLAGEDSVAGAIDDLARTHPDTYLVLLRPGDQVAPGIRDALGARPGADAIIFDDDVLTLDGRRCRPRLKPGVQPELLLEHDYVGRGAALHGSAVIRLGGFGDLNQQGVRDVLLRAIDGGGDVAKVDHVLVHLSPDAEQDDAAAAREVVTRTLARRGIADAAVVRHGIHGAHISYPLPPDRMVSVIIPFRDQVELLRECVSSIKRLTLHPTYELLLVDNGSTDEATLGYLKEIAQDPVVQVLPFPEPFNYSRVNNFAAAHANGDVLLFLNNDTRVLTPEWMETLAGQAWQDDIGTVGAHLHFANGRIQHAGVVIGVGGFAAHVFAGAHKPFLPRGLADHARNCSAVTGACCAVRADRFNSIGGFDESFIVTGSDVELGLRFLHAGYRNVVLPHVSLFHYEKQTRAKIPVNPVDIRRSLECYQPHLREGDPYWNRNLSTTSTEMLPRTRPEPGYLELLAGVRGKLLAESAANDRHRSAMLLSQYDAGKDHVEANEALMASFRANRTIPLESVTWFVPHFDHVYRGGIYTIMRLADAFSRRSGTLNHVVIYGRAQVDLAAIDQQVREAFPEARIQLHLLRPGDDVRRLPAADVGICTLWNSAYHLLRYNQCRGKFYLVQDYEPVFEPANAISGLIEQSYRFGFVGLANTPGVADAYRAYGNEAMAFVPAVDTNLFHPGDDSDTDRPLRIVFYGRPTNPRNGFQLGVQALTQIKARYGDKVDIVSAGAAFDPVDEGLAGVLTNVGVLPNMEQVADLYRSSDIGLVFMYSRHPSYQPLEYMASGCATVTNYNEANLWLLRHRENALLAMPTVTGVVDAIEELIEQPELRRKIIDGGLETVSGRGWEEQLTNIHRYVLTGES